ncbi:MAG: heme-binding protein [Verrucomicrobiota bacterium]
MGPLHPIGLSRAAALTVLGLALAMVPGQGREPMKPGKVGEVQVRVVEGYPAAESVFKGDVAEDWPTGFRRCARYVKFAGDEIRLPVIVNYPDWKDGEPATPTTLTVHLMMDPSGRFPMPREKDIGVVEVPELTVVSYAFQGAYDFENQKQALEKIRAYMKEKNIPAIGPPRTLYYSNVDWTMSIFLVGEVQVPVPPQERKL